MAETIEPSSNTAAVAASATDDVDQREYLTLEEWAEFFRFKKGRDSPSEVRNALLVIATLITTATYQAVLSPPGGLWQDDNEALGQEAGKTILGTRTVDYRFALFLASNSAGFYGSLFIIDLLTEGFPLRLELYFIIVALIASYDFAMISIIPQGRLSTLFTLLSIFLPLVIGLVAKMARKGRILGRRGHRKAARLFQNMTSSGP